MWIWDGKNSDHKSGIRNTEKYECKNQDPDPGWATRIIFPRALKHFFGV